MPKRTLYIAAYDIRDDKRLGETLDVVKGYATGGQKSAYECFLTDAERRALITEVRDVMDLSEDRFLLVRLDPRCRIYTLGVAVRPEDPTFFYQG